MSLFNLIKSDYEKYKKYGGNFMSIVFFTQGFWAIFQYRIAHAIFNLKIPIVRGLCKFVCLLWQKCIEVCTGISIPASCIIGPSFYIGHFGGIIFNANTVIGSNCNVSQGVTIGVSGLANKRGVPIIGNNVYIGANAVIAGKINVGNNVIIGACSLMTKNAKDGEIWLGVPAQQISLNEENGYI